MRQRRCWLFAFSAGVISIGVSTAAENFTTSADFDGYVGNYAMSRRERLRITREESHLVAEPPGNQPRATLIPDGAPDRFEMRGAAFEFQFIRDSTGRIIRLEITGPDGKIRRLPRVPDAETARASVRATAVNADTAVHARVFNGYERRRDAAGNLVPETYAFGEGGFQSTNPAANASLDTLAFEELARMLAPGLANQGYVSTPNVDQTDLLVMIYWGATASDEHPAVIAEEEADPTRHTFRDQLNRENAKLLGFESILPHTDSTVRDARKRDSVDRLEESRYWVALVAVDFRLLRQEKQMKPLWSVRYSMPSRSIGFTTAVPQMTQVAAHFFGRNSGGLLERGTTGREGSVEFGEAIVLEDENEAAEQEALPDDEGVH